MKGDRKGIKRIFVPALALCLAVWLSEVGGTTAVKNGNAASPQRSTSAGALLIAGAASAPAFGEVAAVLAQCNCLMCHMGADPRKGLRLDTYENLMKGGENGPVVVPGAPEKSELVLRVKGSRQPRMPIGGPPWLSKDAVKILEDWIAAGAKNP